MKRLVLLVLGVIVLSAGCSCTLPATPGLTVSLDITSPTPAAAAPAIQRVIVREYPELRADGSEWLVTKWSAHPLYTDMLIKAASTQPTVVPAVPATVGCSTINPSPFVGGKWEFTGGNGWSLTGGSQTIHGARGWVIHTPGHPDDPGLPAGKAEATDAATAYNLGCQ